LKYNPKENLFLPLEEMHRPPEYSPKVVEVTTIVTTIRKESPNLGLHKVLLAIRQNEPTWTLSEKARTPRVVIDSSVWKGFSQNPKHEYFNPFHQLSPDQHQI
jgi:hypothetical protein